MHSDVQSERLGQVVHGLHLQFCEIVITEPNYMPMVTIRGLNSVPDLRVYTVSVINR